MNYKLMLISTALCASGMALASCVTTTDAQAANPQEETVEAAADPAPTPTPTPAPTATTAAQSATTQLGRALFLRCSACHAVSADEPTKIGPHLQGVVGRTAGSVEGYGYSTAMVESGIVWNRENLDLFLTRPATQVPGTSMAFGGLDSAQQRTALIDYLESLD